MPSTFDADVGSGTDYLKLDRVFDGILCDGYNMAVGLDDIYKVRKIA